MYETEEREDAHAHRQGSAPSGGRGRGKCPIVGWHPTKSSAKQENDAYGRCHGCVVRGFHVGHTQFVENNVTAVSSQGMRWVPVGCRQVFESLLSFGG